MTILDDFIAAWKRCFGPAKRPRIACSCGKSFTRVGAGTKRDPYRAYKHRCVTVNIIEPFQDPLLQGELHVPKLDQ